MAIVSPCRPGSPWPRAFGVTLALRRTTLSRTTTRTGRFLPAPLLPAGRATGSHFQTIKAERSPMRANRVVALGLMIFCLSGHAEEDAAQRLAEAGMPAISRAWQGEDYLTAAQVLASGKVALPRYSEDPGTALFARFVSTENFSFQRDASVSQQVRLADISNMLMGVASIGKTVHRGGAQEDRKRGSGRPLRQGECRALCIHAAPWRKRDVDCRRVHADVPPGREIRHENGTPENDGRSTDHHVHWCRGNAEG